MAIKVSKTLYREVEQVKKVSEERNIDILDTKAIAELVRSSTSEHSTWPSWAIRGAIWHASKKAWT